MGAGMSGTEFASPMETLSAIVYGPAPVVVFRERNINANYIARLNGKTGDIPIGDPQTRKRTGWLPSQQAFVGAQQLVNLVNAKIGLSTAIPSTKPNPGVVALTAMQSQLAAMGAMGQQ